MNAIKTSKNPKKSLDRIGMVWLAFVLGVGSLLFSTIHAQDLSTVPEDMTYIPSDLTVIGIDKKVDRWRIGNRGDAISTENDDALVQRGFS